MLRQPRLSPACHHVPLIGKAGISVIILQLSLVAVFLMAGSVRPAAGQGPPPGSPERMLVLPFYNMSEIYGRDASMRGPISGKVFLTGEVAPEADTFLAAKLRALLVKRGGIQVLDPSAETIGAMAGLHPLVGSTGERIAMIQRAGRRQGAQVVCCAYLYAFRKRVGRDFGVETPARVSFELNLIRVDTGAVIWQRDFCETQQALNDDLLKIGRFIRRKGRWVSAEEMAVQALQDLVEEIEVRR